MAETAVASPHAHSDGHELAEWLEAADQGRRAPRHQHPADELFAEHQLARAIIEVIEVEARKLLAGELPSSSWSGIVDFIGNFMHQCHRQKEELAMFPAITGALPRIAALRFEHRRAERSTVELIDAIEEGDWERVLRVAAAYAGAMRKHMEHEEQEIFPMARASVSGGRVHEMRAGFDAIEAKVLRRGREHYVELTRRLCANAGIDPKPHGLG